MKVMYSYLSTKGEMWDMPFCRVINYEKYDINYLRYLANSVWELRFIEDIDIELSEISRVERGEIKCFQTGIDIFSVDVYKDRVEFIDYFDEYEDWSCTVEEYKRVLLGQKAFLMLPKEPESYLEIKINDIE